MRHAEDQIQIALVAHIKRRKLPGVVYFHPANGGKRDKREAAKLKAMGVLPGASDLIFLHCNRFYALELKAEGGRATEEQMQFISDVNTAGGFGAIVHGLDKALRALETWGLLKGATVLSTCALDGQRQWRRAAEGTTTGPDHSAIPVRKARGTVGRVR